jgi:hypothetical protein
MFVKKSMRVLYQQKIYFYNYFQQNPSDHGMACENPNGSILITKYLNESLMIDTNRTVYGIVSNIFTQHDYVSVNVQKRGRFLS